MATQVHDRTSKYIQAAREAMRSFGHATNAQLLDQLRVSFPDLSATTVHRITSRMLARGELQLAPSSHHNVTRLDYNLEPHDHFRCEQCDQLKDAHFAEKIRPLLEVAVGDGCSISGSLTVSGVCKKCRKELV